jgi:hypothetical protein
MEMPPGHAARFCTAASDYLIAALDSRRPRHKRPLSITPFHSLGVQSQQWYNAWRCEALARAERAELDSATSSNFTHICLGTGLELRNLVLCKRNGHGGRDHLIGFWHDLPGGYDSIFLTLQML